MTHTGQESTPVLSAPKRFLLCTGVHALLVAPALALNLALGLGWLSCARWMKDLADGIGLLLWLPINGFVQNHLEIFFMLVPLNSLLYGFAGALVWHAIQRRKR